MIDKIKALIKRANELDLDNNFKDADLVDEMIKEFKKNTQRYLMGICLIVLGKPSQRHS